MSGHPANVMAREGVLDEGVPFLSKPCDIPALTQRVREVLEAASTSDVKENITNLGLI